MFFRSNLTTKKLLMLLLRRFPLDRYKSVVITGLGDKRASSRDFGVLR